MGGPEPTPDGHYSVYAQIVNAKRDACAYAHRNVFPNAKAVRLYAKENPNKKSQMIYQFHENVEPEIVETAKCKTTNNTLSRIAFVLYRFRKALRTDGKTLALNSEEARTAVNGIRLTKAEFVKCGGHKTVSDKRVYSFYRQVDYAVSDMQTIMTTGKCYKTRKDSVDKSKAGIDKDVYISTDEEEEEDPHMMVRDTQKCQEEGQEEGEKSQDIDGGDDVEEDEDEDEESECEYVN